MKCKYCDFELHNEKTKEWRDNVMHWHEDGHQRELMKAATAAPQPFDINNVPPPPMPRTASPPPYIPSQENRANLPPLMAQEHNNKVFLDFLRRYIAEEEAKNRG